MWIRITPRYESYSDSESETNDGIEILMYSEYSGVTIICGGSRLPAVKRISSVFRNGIFTRVSANARNDARNSVMITPGIAT